MLESNSDHRFRIQRIEKDAWIRTTIANAVADYDAGHQQLVRTFLEGRAEEEFQRLRSDLQLWSPQQIQERAAANRQSSLLFLVLMLTGLCNADCPICFTDRKRKPDELGVPSRDRLLRQARELGARFVYVPGEGEPTLDPGFWQMLETCREISLEAIIFTNGILLSDPVSCQKYWGCDPKEAIRRLRDYPVSFYFKLWSTKPALVSEMMRIPSEKYHYCDYYGRRIPGGLINLMQEFPRERVGIEVVIERRNADEVIECLVPFAEENGLSRIVEMIQHNGRTLSNQTFDPTPVQARRVEPTLSPTSCSMATCKAVVTSRGYLSPRIAVLEHQIPGTPVHVEEGDLFHLLHHTNYIVDRRYDVINCLCEQLPKALTCSMSRLTSTGLVNIAPPGFASCGTGAAKHGLTRD
jgi:hypothetical protein